MYKDWAWPPRVHDTKARIGVLLTALVVLVFA